MSDPVPCPCATRLGLPIAHINTSKAPKLDGDLVSRQQYTLMSVAWEFHQAREHGAWVDRGGKAAVDQCELKAQAAPHSDQLWHVCLLEL
eukprot:5790678-Prymnesium_polylepis.1